ncbi:MAG: EscU/YscU/HrcU family type III secretion system export apparatus switch protein [Lachnospiraceae bacterium]|nr:EscU/YscU/HrcU family type III secretion system export apparatus switch protein [Lachnospiraceae bacterium]
MADSKKLKEKVKTAVAIAYDPANVAPTVVASGKGAVAEKIIETAKESDVPVHEDSKLAETLSGLEIGDAIPPELYEVVAEVLVFVDRMDKLRQKMDAYNATKRP